MRHQWRLGSRAWSIVAAPISVGTGATECVIGPSIWILLGAVVVVVLWISSVCVGSRGTSGH